MTKAIRSLLILLVIAFLAPVAHADSVTFTGVNGVHDSTYYVSPYYGTINGTPVTLFCIDIRNSVHIGQTWQANLSTITNGSDLSNTRYGSLPNSLVLYQEAAWLVTQFSSHPGSWVDLQYALWNLFTPSTPDTAGAMGSNWWIQQAQLNYTTINLADFRVVTNTQPVNLTGQVQEFLIQVPEPGSLMLLGAGLAGIAALRRRRHHTAV